MSTTHGIPNTGTRFPRSALTSSTRAIPPTSAATIFAAVSERGGATSPESRRRASLFQVVTAKIATMTSITAHPAVRDSVPLPIPLITWSWTRIEPPLPSTQSITPCQNSRPPRVTTKDGRPMAVMSVPCSRPTSAATTRPARIAAHHGQPTVGLASTHMTTALRPATNPRDRSISPSSSTKTSPIASRLNTAAWTSRFTRFPGVRNRLLRDWNSTETSTSPATTDSTPVSPLRTRVNDARR